nr:unnamed protein product [Callosobruchus analis]
MVRHLELKHAELLEVAKVLAKPKGSKDRREGFLYLIRVRDFYHNMEVLAAKQGQLLLARRPRNREDIPHFKFGPCPYCLGFMLKSALWHHVRVCKAKKAHGNNEIIRHTVTAESNAMVNSILFSEESQFVEKVLSSFINDNISDVCNTDGLIRSLGMILFEKHGNSQHEHIRQTMRQVGGLLLEIREKLLDLEWTCRISSSALNTMVTNKMNCAEVLPLRADLMKLNKYIAKEIAVFSVLLEKNHEEKYAWIRLAEAVSPNNTIFNKRRSGEASKLTINQFLTDTKWEKECTGELWSTLKLPEVVDSEDEKCGNDEDDEDEKTEVRKETCGVGEGSGNLFFTLISRRSSLSSELCVYTSFLFTLSKGQ